MSGGMDGLHPNNARRPPVGRRRRTLAVVYLGRLPLVRALRRFPPPEGIAARNEKVQPVCAGGRYVGSPAWQSCSPSAVAADPFRSNRKREMSEEQANQPPSGSHWKSLATELGAESPAAERPAPRPAPPPPVKKAPSPERTVKPTRPGSNWQGLATELGVDPGTAPAPRPAAPPPPRVPAPVTQESEPAERQTAADAPRERPPERERRPERGRRPERDRRRGREERQERSPAPPTNWLADDDEGLDLPSEEPATPAPEGSAAQDDEPRRKRRRRRGRRGRGRGDDARGSERQSGGATSDEADSREAGFEAELENESDEGDDSGEDLTIEESAATAEGAPTSEEPRRRRRRRGGRSRRRRNDESREDAPRRGGDRQPTEGRVPQPEEPADDDEPFGLDEDDAGDVEFAPAAAMRASAGDEHDEDGNEDAGDEVAAHAHKAIPSWQETIGFLVERNLESRAKNPVGDRPRSRGGRGRRGRGDGRPPRNN